MTEEGIKVSARPILVLTCLALCRLCNSYIDGENCVKKISPFSRPMLSSMVIAETDCLQLFYALILIKQGS